MSSRPMTFFMFLKTAPAWLAKSRAERLDYTNGVLAPLLAQHPAVRLRYFDAEAFTGCCTDIAVWEAQDPRDYYRLVDRLREEAFFAVPYFEVVEIIPAIEDAWRDDPRQPAA